MAAPSIMKWEILNLICDYNRFYPTQYWVKNTEKITKTIKIIIHERWTAIIFALVFSPFFRKRRSDLAIALTVAKTSTKPIAKIKKHSAKNQSIKKACQASCFFKDSVSGLKNFLLLKK